jgi:hypothetical protein
MSTIFAGTNSSMRRRQQSPAYPHESNSWTSLLNDLGLTRDDAIEKANKPFWR